MKSSYLDPQFADFWEKRCGDEGQAYQRYVLDPLLFELLQDTGGKRVLELGCGNGSLAKKLLLRGVAALILLDESPYNLEHASRRCSSNPAVTYVCQDATKSWQVSSETADIIVSQMMLNEVQDISTPINEAFRVLRPGGLIACSVFHPSFDLFMYAQQQAGMAQNKIPGIEGYFVRKYLRYDMGTESKTSPDLAGKYSIELSVRHYHRPAADYHEALTAAGFSVRRYLEPPLTGELLEAHPGFEAYRDRPIALMFLAGKPAK